MAFSVFSWQLAGTHTWQNGWFSHCLTSCCGKSEAGVVAAVAHVCSWSAWPQSTHIICALGEKGHHAVHTCALSNAVLYFTGVSE